MITDFLKHSVNLIPWRVRTIIRKLPIIAGIQRWLLKTFLYNQTFTHLINAGPAKGLKYPISLPRDKAIWSGTYEIEFATVLSHSVKPGYICYDIGGYRGFFSGVLALAGAKSVIVFEPFPENIAQLDRLAENNPQLPLCIKSMAVGDKDGFADFYAMTEPSMGKITSSPFQSDIKGESLLTVPIAKLDSLVLGEVIPPPQVIKIDVEGAEMQVLDGASKMLELYHPQLFIEAHSSELAAKCTLMLKNLGYCITMLEDTFDKQHNTEICHLIATLAHK
jgi:FkbM family methyltransferase